jgi:hypothetical protein
LIFASRLSTPESAFDDSAIPFNPHSALEAWEDSMDAATSTNRLNGSEIAIIGMVCRFPGARSVEEFWRNLRDGVESISFLRD